MNEITQPDRELGTAKMHVHKLLEAAYYPAHDSFDSVMALAYCACGLPLTAYSSSESACNTLIRRKYRKHLRSVTQ